LLLAEFVGDPIDNALIEVIATKVCITIRRLDLKDTLT